MKFLNPNAEGRALMPLGINYHASKNFKDSDFIEIIYKDMLSSKKYVETIENPYIEVYVVKPEYRKDYTYHRDYAPLEHLMKCKVHYKSRYYELGKLLEIPSNEVRFSPYIFGSDIQIETWYFIQFIIEYPNDQPKELSVAFFDIENDIIGKRYGEKTLYGETPINAIVYVDSERMQVYQLLLTSPNPILFEPSTNNAITEEREKMLALWNRQVPEFVKSIPEYIQELHEEFDESFGEFEYHILPFDSEKELLQTFWDIVNASDNDFIEAWNIPWDMNNILMRTSLYFGSYDSEAFQRVVKGPSFQLLENRSIYFTEDNNPITHKRKHRCNLPITAVASDQMVNYGGVRAGRGTIPSYKLNAIAKTVLKDEKYNYSEEANIRTLPYINYKKFSKYNIKDSLLQYGIDKETKDTSTIYNRCYMNAVLPVDAFTTTTLLTNALYLFLYRDCGMVLGNNRNKLFPTNHSQNEFYIDEDDESERLIGATNGEEDEETEVQFDGAYVSDTMRLISSGFEVNGILAKFIHEFVIDMDLTSLYPSIIKIMNSSNETLFGKLFIREEDLESITIPMYYSLTETERKNYSENKSVWFMNTFVQKEYLNLCEIYFGLPNVESVLKTIEECLCGDTKKLQEKYKSKDISSEAIILQKWRIEIKEIVHSIYGDRLKDRHIDCVLSEIIEENLRNVRCDILNNYRHKNVSSDLLTVTDLILKESIIVGGDGVMYISHEKRENPLIDFINSVMTNRSTAKKERKRFVKGSNEFLYYDILQLIFKLIINSLYGVLGYHGFVLYNLFLAQSITAMGQDIITTTASGFENFFRDNVAFRNENELFHYIRLVQTDYKTTYNARQYPEFKTISKEQVLRRIINKCNFELSPYLITRLSCMLDNMHEDELKILYYKNNLFEFSRTPVIKERLKTLYTSMGDLLLPELDIIQDPTTRILIEEIWDYYSIFVFHNHPIYDRIRNTKYTDRKAVLYIDTDSNFIGLNPWMKFIETEILERPIVDQSDQFKIINVFIIFLTNVVSNVLLTMATSCGISPDVAKQLSMKNEYLIKRIVFSKVKKRYFSLPLLQEGMILPEGSIDIKGYDFIKSVTKQSLRERYSKICLNDILKPDAIDLPGISKKAIDLRRDLRKQLESGNAEYFKQANVGILEKYKNPYSIQGIKAILLWNALMPEYTLELPADVDIVPIKEIVNPYAKKKVTTNEDGAIKMTRTTTTNKNQWLIDQHPEIYDQIRDKLFLSEVEGIAGITKLTCIAKPKNVQIPLPQWFYDIMDINKIIDDSLNLFNPVLEALGINLSKVNSTTNHFTTIVSL